MIRIIIVPVDRNLLTDVRVFISTGTLLELIGLIKIVAHLTGSCYDLLNRILAALQRPGIYGYYVLVKIQHSSGLKDIPCGYIVRDADDIILKLLHKNQRVLIDLVVHARDTLFEVFIGINHHDTYGKCSQSGAVHDKQQNLPDKVCFLISAVHIYCFSTLYPTPHTTLR